MLAQGLQSCGSALLGSASLSLVRMGAAALDTRRSLLHARQVRQGLSTRHLSSCTERSTTQGKGALTSMPGLLRQSIAVMMCGVQSPSIGRRGTPQGADANGAPSAPKSAIAEPAAPTTAAAAVSAGPPASPPEPLGQESKEFVEMRALNRCCCCAWSCCAARAGEVQCSRQHVAVLPPSLPLSPPSRRSLALVIMGLGLSAVPAAEASLMCSHLQKQTLHRCREVRVVLEGVDKSGNLFGTIMYPHGEEAADLGLHLVQAGLAKVSPRASLPVSCASGGHKYAQLQWTRSC